MEEDFWQYLPWHLKEELDGLFWGAVLGGFTPASADRVRVLELIAMANKRTGI